MAKLVKCKSCKTKISENAEVCPKCGEPNPIPEKGTSSFTTIVFALLIIGLINAVLNTGGSSTSSKTTTTVSTHPTENKPNQATIEWNKNKLKRFKDKKENIIKDINNLIT